MSFEAIFNSGSSRVQRRVKAPEGALGLKLTSSNKSGRPKVTGLAEGSPLSRLVGVGWELVAVDDEDVRSMGAAAVATLLQERAQTPRLLTFIHQYTKPTDLSAVGGTTFQVEAPAGWLGITFATRQRGGTEISSVAPASVMLERLVPGWHLLTVNDTDVSALDHEAVAKLLRDSADAPRTLILAAPPATWTATLLPVVLIGVFAALVVYLQPILMPTRPSWRERLPVR